MNLIVKMHEKTSIGCLLIHSFISFLVLLCSKSSNSHSRILTHDSILLASAIFLMDNSWSVQKWMAGQRRISWTSFVFFVLNLQTIRVERCNCEPQNCIHSARAHFSASLFQIDRVFIDGSKKWSTMGITWCRRCRYDGPIDHFSCVYCLFVSKVAIAVDCCPFFN